VNAGDARGPTSFRRLAATDYVDKYRDWADRVDRMHQGFREATNAPISWSPLSKELSRCRVALVTTSGVHRRSDVPFDQLSPEGDPSLRVIRADDRGDDLMVSHNHFDHSDADRDINCLFPIEPLRKLAEEGVVGDVSPVHVGFMGFNPDPRPVRRHAKEAAALLARAEVDVVVLTPG
jgi:D-proline reductase (dithiol) PrdB